MWGIVLQHKDEISLARQIFLSFKNQILTGQILQGEALPSTRELAKGLGVSRNTVCEAYEMLLAEGFIVSRQGASSRVVEGLRIQTYPKTTLPVDQKKKRCPILWDFKTGQPDLSLFPWLLWSQLIRDAANHLPVKYLEYTGPKGYPPVCEEIAKWLRRSRSMDVNPADIFITTGTTQALHLLVDLLHKEDHKFVLENPSHPGIRTVIVDKEHPLGWMSVDEQGADISSLKDEAVSAVYVTPSHQFPLGGILPADRRATLVRLAIENDFYIIEDDYDSEFRYSGSPVSPIHAMDDSRVIYVGTFSKTLFPALRLGFAILPKSLQEKWSHHRNFMDVQNPILEQVVLTEFLRKRKMEKHIQYMRRLYGEKREVLLRSVEENFGNLVRPWGDNSGLHVALQFRGMSLGEEFEKESRESGIRLSSLIRYCNGEDHHKDKLLLGYGHLSHGQIKEGIRALHQLMIRRYDFRE